MDKEYYENQIIEIGKFLIRKSRDIMEDMNTEYISEITFISKMSPGEIPTVQVHKEYIALQINKEE